VATFHNLGDAILEQCDGNSSDFLVKNDSAAQCLKAPGFSHKAVDQMGVFAPPNVGGAPSKQ